MLILDTLFPPSPDQLVFDCMALGADGCWAYVLRRSQGGGNLGLGSWTALHVDALHVASKFSGGIVVPGDVPPTGQACIDALRAMHCDPILATDLEQFSLPPTWWEDQLEGLEQAEGVHGIDYGTSSTLGTYDPGEPNWLAAWLRTGILNPIPALPPGRPAWQFVNDVPAPSGVTYDVSVVDPSLFKGVAKMTRDGWALFCGAFIVVCVSDPPGSKPGATDPSGGPYYWDYYWADQILSLGERAGGRAFLDWLKANAKVPIPLIPGLGVAAHHHLPASASVVLSNSGDVIAGA